MTELTKPIKRSMTLLLDRRERVRARDKIAVTLYPDHTIGFRPYKSRREYRLPIVVAYKLAILEAGKEERKEREVRRKIKRGLI